MCTTAWSNCCTASGGNGCLDRRSRCIRQLRSRLADFLLGAAFDASSGAGGDEPHAASSSTRRRTAARKLRVQRQRNVGT